MLPERVFVTFGGGKQIWRLRARTLARSMKALELFDEVMYLDDRSLDDLVPGFTARHSELIRESPRGFGLWLWKPAMLAALLGVTRPRVVVYLDAGCDVGLSPAARAAWVEMLDRVQTDHPLVFECEVPQAVEYAYTKADLLDYLQVGPAQRRSQQAMAGAVALANSPQSKALVTRWQEIAIQDGYRYLDDSPSRQVEHPGFIAHRHDQSILSCLCKTSGVSLRPVPTGPVPTDRPFLPARNRGLFSSLDDRPLARGERAVHEKLVALKQRLRR